MRFYGDLHVHTRFSRATSRDSDLEHLALWAGKKGIRVVGTGDFTHPGWFAELGEKLIPAEDGLFRLREEAMVENPAAEGRWVEVLGDIPSSCRGPVSFILSVEISTIYKKGERTRKVHHVVFVPSLAAAARLNRSLAKVGNIASDGRPILGLDSRHLLEMVLESDEDSFLVPAHIWTPWFAVFGSKSGFDSLEECYGDLADRIFAVETGLSSDPPMNWRVSGLDRCRLVSNSDAHSPSKLGREACVFDAYPSYFSILAALRTGKGYVGTMEFFPDEGKYHLDGHRKCGVRLEAAESRRLGGLCPKCGSSLTLGVMHRVEELADRKDGSKPASAGDFRSLIPLNEILSEIADCGPSSKTVLRQYEDLIRALGPEIGILADIPPEVIGKASASPLLEEAIRRMRRGQVKREAGYDGEYGVIRLFRDEELKRSGFSGVLFPLSAKKNEPERKNSSASARTALCRRGPVP